jgi:hypothetical protein
MCELRGPPGDPCLVLAQGDPNRPHATLLIKITGGKTQRADLCIVPYPAAAQRTGEYPR